MRKIVGIIGAVLVAALVPAIYFGISGRSFRAALLAFALASLWVVLLGLPTFFLFKYPRLGSLVVRDPLRLHPRGGAHGAHFMALSSKLRLWL